MSELDEQAIEKLMRLAEQGNEAAAQELLRYFDPYIRRHSGVNGVIDDDVAQFIRLSFWRTFGTGATTKPTSRQPPSKT